MSLLRCLILAGCALLLNACGFHLSNQTRISEVVPVIVLTGEYHHPFFRMVKQRLELNGIEVITQDSPVEPDKPDAGVPVLMIASPHLSREGVSVDSRARSLEYNMLVETAATLFIPNHRPILIKNSLTRSALNKSGRSLASETERSVVDTETMEELAAQLVQRIGYLGRLSDPNTIDPTPAELTLNEDENIAIPDRGSTRGMTLLEALRAQDEADAAAAVSIDAASLNNGSEVLKTPRLPRVAPKLAQPAPVAAGN